MDTFPPNGQTCRSQVLSRSTLVNRLTQGIPGLSEVPACYLFSSLVSKQIGRSVVWRPEPCGNRKSGESATAPRRVVLHCTKLCRTAMYCAVPRRAALHQTLTDCGVLRRAASCCTAPNSDGLRRTAPCRVVLHCTKL